MNHTKTTPLHFFKRLHGFGFTLVELIVVITILAILGTIAFVSFTGYSGSARDSNRIADLSNTTKSLEMYFIRAGSYPTPSNTFAVTYSGGVLWNQGTIGDSVITALAVGNARLSKKPVDPLTGTEYAYSLASGNMYLVKANYEGDNLSYKAGNTVDGAGANIDPMIPNPLFEQASAASGNPLLSYIKGNYNGVAVKIQVGGIYYLIATPSIMSNTGSAGTPIDISTNNILSGSLLTNGGNLTGVPFQPVLANAIVFSGANLPTSDTEKVAFATNIANAYSGTSLAANSTVAPFIAALGNSGTLASLGGTVTASLGGTVAATTGNNTNSTPSVVTYANADGSASPYISDSANGSVRFTLTGSNTVVVDNITGLQWQSYKSTGSADYTANYAVTSTWLNAKAYCAGLTL